MTLRTDDAESSVASRISAEDRIAALEADLERARVRIEALETELRERESHSARDVAAAQAANDAKSLFLANMSHELRTPLHGILSFAKFGITRHGSLTSEKSLHYFEMIHRSASSLLELLNDLLDLSKLESGRAEFHFETVRLADLVLHVQSEFEARLRERDLTLTTDFEGSTHCEIDTERMLQVLRNLVGNAIKFSPSGGTVGVTIEPRDDRLWLSVRDQGCGIPEEELDEVFDEFVQSSTTQTSAGGTGLGLAICRQIVEGHHGWIWARNDEEGGASLTFELPVRQPAAPAGASDDA